MTRGWKLPASGHCLLSGPPGDFLQSHLHGFPHSTRKPQALFPLTCVPVPMSVTSHIQLPCARCGHRSHFPGPVAPCPLTAPHITMGGQLGGTCSLFLCPQVLHSAPSSASRLHVLCSLCSKVHSLYFQNLCAPPCPRCPAVPMAHVAASMRAVDLMRHVLCRPQCPRSQIPGPCVLCLHTSMYP